MRVSDVVSGNRSVADALLVPGRASHLTPLTIMVKAEPETLISVNTTQQTTKCEK